jgi:hypothetical protein
MFTERERHQNCTHTEMRILVTFISVNASCDSVQTLLSNICIFTHLWAARGGAVGSGTALQAGRSRVRLGFFIGIVLPVAPRPWGRLSLLTELSTRNISQWVKGGRCVRLTTCPDIIGIVLPVALRPWGRLSLLIELCVKGGRCVRLTTCRDIIGIVLPVALRPWGRLSLLTELWVKGGRCVELTTCRDTWQPQPPGTPQGLSRPVHGKLYFLLIYGAKCTNGVKIYTMQKQFVKFFLQPFKA